VCLKAHLIFTGTELLLGQIVNTNAQYLGSKLAEIGIDLYSMVTVGDNRSRITEAINAAKGKAELVIINGGLGPTEDDVTREALADALALELQENPVAFEIISRFFKSRGLPMPETNTKQALVPEGGKVLDNPIGTAPGLLVCHDASIYVLLPGPPKEMATMFEQEVIPYLQKEYQVGGEIKSRILKVVGLGEPGVEERVKDLVGSLNPTLAPTVKQGEVHLRITAKSDSPEEIEAMLTKMEQKVRDRLDEHIFGVDDCTLEEAVGRELKRLGYTIAVAESCTGGLLAHRLTNVPGSSGYFQLGVVTYANRWKTRFLRVGTEVLAAHGAVSPETAQAMAVGVRGYTGVDVSVGITGIAGPSGESETKPVGLVYIGVNYLGKVDVFRHQFNGDRETIKYRATQAALTHLWQKLSQIQL
jgi:nicotinamide-nucleotide amidase